MAVRKIAYGGTTVLQSRYGLRCSSLLTLTSRVTNKRRRELCKHGGDPERAVLMDQARQRLAHQDGVKRFGRNAGPLITGPCKSALALAPVPDGPSCIERESDREFALAKISERGFLSNRKRSSIILRSTVTGRPPPPARRRRRRRRQDRCTTSSDCPSPSR
jgi:hypothetical protein